MHMDMIYRLSTVRAGVCHQTISGLGDAFLFRCYQLIGPRIGLLLLSLAPVFSAIIAGLFFGDRLTAAQFAGMAVTLAGIGWVVLSRPVLQAGEVRTRLSARGVLYGIIAALGQASGLALSREGMSGNFPPFAGTLIRMIAAIVFLWVMAVIQKEVGATVEAVRTHPSAFGWAAFGAFFGPVIGVARVACPEVHEKTQILLSALATASARNRRSGCSTFCDAQYSGIHLVGSFLRAPTGGLRRTFLASSPTFRAG